MKTICLLGTLVIIYGAYPAKAWQVDSADTQVERQLEEALEEVSSEDGQIGEDLVGFLEDLSANPVNLNTADLTDLLQIPGVNLKVAQAILAYRSSKPFEVKQELLKVSGIGQRTYARIQPYVTIGGASSRFRHLYSRPEYWMDGNQLEMISRYQRRLQLQKGYQIPDSSGGFTGQPYKYYQRFRFNTRHVSLGLTQEKDAGEMLNSATGFDFNSFHLALNDNGMLKSLVIGDYSLNFGQGLVMWTGGAFGKGRDVIGSINKNERGLRPYSSAQETDFFRGIAGSYGHRIQFTGFYSGRSATAAVIEGDTVRFPSSSGLHRTINELDRKNNLRQEVAGGRIRIATQAGLLGMTGYVSQFDRPIYSDNVNEFKGAEHSVLGMDFRSLLGTVLLFGEWAVSRGGGQAGIVGLETQIGWGSELALLYRNFGQNFQSFFGDGFGESSSEPQNEEGFYLGLRHRLTERISVATYVDQYYFKTARPGLNQPGRGFDYLGLLEVNFNSALSAYLLLRDEVKEQDYRYTDGTGRLSEMLGISRRSSTRIQLEYITDIGLRMRSRIELVQSRSAEGEKESGLLLYQDLRTKITKRSRVDARISLFDTGGFSSRMYQFENDLLYVLNNKVLSGRGQRMYIVVKYQLTPQLDLWIKYSSTVYEDKQVVGSGLNEIEGNRDNAIGIQLRFKLGVL